MSRCVEWSQSHEALLTFRLPHLREALFVLVWRSVTKGFPSGLLLGQRYPGNRRHVINLRLIHCVDERRDHRQMRRQVTLLLVVGYRVGVEVK